MKLHYQDSYKGILYSITRVGSEYHGYLIDVEYSFNTIDESKHQVEANIKSFIDGIKSN